MEPELCGENDELPQEGALTGAALDLVGGDALEQRAGQRRQAVHHLRLLLLQQARHAPQHRLVLVVVLLQRQTAQHHWPYLTPTAYTALFIIGHT